MWGGAPDRNMVSAMKGIPTAWDIQTRTNVKWVAKLGSQNYGNPVVAGGQVYVGTNNELALNPKEGGDRGVLMCFGNRTESFCGSTPARSWRIRIRTGPKREFAPRRWSKAAASTT